MASQILVFHPAMIERIRGTLPPETNVDTDMFVETLTDQVGCIHPHTIVPWRENIIFADERGVFMTDGSTVRNLTELGGMGDFWRQAYGHRIAGNISVCCGTFLDYLIVTDPLPGRRGRRPVHARLRPRHPLLVPLPQLRRHLLHPLRVRDRGALLRRLRQSHKLMKASPMFQDPVSVANPGARLRRRRRRPRLHAGSRPAGSGSRGRRE